MSASFFTKRERERERDVLKAIFPYVSIILYSQRRPTSLHHNLTRKENSFRQKKMNRDKL